MFNLFQWWDNWRHPHHLTIREVEILIEWFDSTEEHPYRSPFVCIACADMGISLSKVQSLADWAFNEGILMSRWSGTGVFHFPAVTEIANFSWKDKRLDLLERYVEWLYEQGDEE